MKTLRVLYTDKQQLDSGIGKAFTLSSDVSVAKIPNCHVVFLDAVTADLLVPDDFDPTLVNGTVVKPANDVVGHIFLGHQKTARIVDSTGKTEVPEIIAIPAIDELVK